jgi:HSP20 family molecular chaperone IbpA
MALFSPFFPMYRNEPSLLDSLDDHPFLNFNSSFFRDANIARGNRANVSETEAGYKVELEVPGYQKSEISIEFGHDGKSLTVSGRSEKSFEEHPTEDGEQSPKPHGVTVEEVAEDGETKQPSSQSQSQAVTETNKDNTVGQPAGPKYWISERNVGSFSRTFTFKSSLDAEKASAALEHGVLTITVPRATKAGVKKISIA